MPMSQRKVDPVGHAAESEQTAGYRLSLASCADARTPGRLSGRRLVSRRTTTAPFPSVPGGRGPTHPDTLIGSDHPAAEVRADTPAGVTS